MRFSSVTIVALIASTVSIMSAQDCNNPLLALYNIPGLQRPWPVQNLPYCDNLRNDQSCCSPSTVASFQGRLNVLIDKLNNYAAAKDLYLAQLRNNYYDRFRDMLSDISDSSDDIKDIRRVNATLADLLQADISSFSQIDRQTRDINRQFMKALNDYQTARTNCFTTALQIQASSWCLACSPDYATQGVAQDGTVIFSDNLCQTISDVCWPFFNEGARFNPLIRAREAYWKLLAISKYLSDFSDDKRVRPFNVSEDLYDPISTQQAIEIPEEWFNGSETANTGRCEDAWFGDELLAELLTVGANVPESQGRVLQDALAGDEGVWDPDLASTGLEFELRSNPGDYFDLSDSSDYLRQAQNRK